MDWPHFEAKKNKKHYFKIPFMYLRPYYLDKIIPVIWQNGKLFKHIKPEKVSSQ